MAAWHASVFANSTILTPPNLLLQDALLNEEERAVLDELDNSFLYDEDTSRRKITPCSDRCRKICEILTHKGVVSLFLTLLLLLVGVGLLIIVKALQLPEQVEQLAIFLLSAGIFGLAGGGTNAIAVVMLLYRIPCLFGSG